jgi:hypothetical protein
MHEVFVASLFGGALAIALFSVLGWIGGTANDGHLHVPHGGHAQVGHAGHAQAAAAHGQTPASSHGAQAHAGHGHGSGAAAHNPVRPSLLSSSLGWTISWISPLTVAGAAVWFGGAGLIAERSASTLALLIAVVAAVIGAALVRSIVRAFVRAGTPPLHLTGEGAIGTVNAAIRADAPGEVVYTLEGLHRSVPARSVDGMAIPRGASVVIVRRESGFAWVTPLDPLSELQPSAVTPLPVGSGREQSLGEAMKPEERER